MNLLERIITKRSITLESITKSWLLCKRPSVKESTYFRYKYIIDKYILSYFKNKNINYFKDYDLNLYIDYLSNQISAKTLKDIMIIFKSILKYIERKFNVDYKLDLISIPKNESEEITTLRETEKKKLEQFCLKKNDLKSIGIIMCLNTGMRIGEICALTWNNIDLEHRFFIIRQSLQRVYKGKKNTVIKISSPKTKNSIRRIPISKKIYLILKELKKTNNYSGEEYFLTGNKNKYIEPRNYQYIFKKCLRICNIPDYNFHVLRHTFATNCIKIGMDAKSLSELLGHSDVNITLNKYVHSSYTRQKNFLEKL